MLSVSLSMLLQQVSALASFFLANAIGHRTALLGALFLRNSFLSLACRRHAPRLTPHKSVSRYNCSL